MTRLEALRAAHAHLLARRFDAALAAASPWRRDPAGAVLHGLALAGSGAVERAAPLLARIAAANPGANHPLQDLLPLLAPEQAVAHLRAGLRARPDDIRLLTALGTLLADRGPIDEAVEAFRRAAMLRPADPAAWSNLGKALSAVCRFPEADAAFTSARRLAPSDARIAYNHAVMLLKAGRFAEGWSAFRARHALAGRPAPLPGPRLESLDVAGRTVLLVHDEGFGDTIQFIRYAGALEERGARVVAAMPAALTRLIATAPGVADVTTLPELPRYDLWCPLLDVPALFGAPLAAPNPYLGASEAPLLPPGRKIGVVWAGDPKGLLDPIRSLPVHALTPLSTLPDVTWISLQKGVTPPGWMHDPMAAVRDFADTAGIVAQLDAVIAADTAVAHLAAAMGKPVLLMDRYDNCWRWLSGRDDSPWYPTLRIVRQPAPGDWTSVVRRIAALVAGSRDGS
jgi:hypothetical protein